MHREGSLKLCSEVERIAIDVIDRHSVPRVLERVVTVEVENIGREEVGMEKGFGYTQQRFRRNASACPVGDLACLCLDRLELRNLLLIQLMGSIRQGERIKGARSLGIAHKSLQVGRRLQREVRRYGSILL